MADHLVKMVSEVLSVRPISCSNGPNIFGANFESEDFFVQVLVDDGITNAWPYRLVPADVRILPRGGHPEDFFARRLYDAFNSSGGFFVLLEEEEAGVFVASNFADEL
ncbi:hypothetical protein PUR49_07825 [Streptomyces sp. BE147]|uniref:hypothetical protein n=1 Tax=Streptomyces sp. BE147 TaxID=3002524 RepID=UPI002E79D24B|nr:hypothetical protein [Streptomyces sp. BE147]MEE1736408.1 hypothetical protein [Streptomyces sp. BE147]